MLCFHKSCNACVRSENRHHRTTPYHRRLILCRQRAARRRSHLLLLRTAAPWAYSSHRVFTCSLLWPGDSRLRDRGWPAAKMRANLMNYTFELRIRRKPRRILQSTVVTAAAANDRRYPVTPTLFILFRQIYIIRQIAIKSRMIRSFLDPDAGCSMWDELIARASAPSCG